MESTVLGHTITNSSSSVYFHDDHESSHPRETLHFLCCMRSSRCGQNWLSPRPATGEEIGTYHVER